MLTKSDLMYDLPQELIAQHPPKVRGSCRLMVLNRKNQTISDGNFQDITGFIKPLDTVVLNNTRVINARLQGRRDNTGGAAELLLLEKLEPGLWNAMIRPGRRCRKGNVFLFSNDLKAVVVDEYGNGRGCFRFYADCEIEDAIQRTATLPLPPYIHRPVQKADNLRYQTVFAEKHGAVAAPTAGLHFTEAMLSALADSGTGIQYITLHVGPGTFQPLREEVLADNAMEEEFYSVSSETKAVMNSTREAGGRIIAVGTTVARTLESIDLESDLDQEGKTSIFIHPPYRFRNVDVLLTNFHLPGSSLISMVGSFAGLDFLMKAYSTAIEKRYKFYSYGDAMLIV